MLTPNFDTLIEIQEAFSDVFFFDKDHSYKIAGESAKISVSGLLSKYEKPFNSDKIAPNIAKKRGIDVYQLLNEWNDAKEYSCHKGSEFHLHIENFLERKLIPIDKSSFEEFNKKHTSYSINEYYNEMAIIIRSFRDFYDWWKQDHVLIKSEFVIGDKEYMIGGTIDNLSYNKKTKKFVIFDYKTNKKIDKKNSYGEKMLCPVDHLDKCEFNKYSLQLNMYSLLFEKNTNFKVDDCYIVWFPNQINSTYEILKCIDVKKECNLILNDTKYL
jgi:ATP-dependent exoDNAse (exonuclease V) beta subunit